MSRFRGRRFIDQYLEGRSIVSLFDDDYVPSTVQLASDIRRELLDKHIHCNVESSRQGDNVIYITLSEKSYTVDGLLDIYERAYPEVKILVTTSQQ